ncbi:MAG: type II toxin-antitoxin system VapC family toxin [Verrucomicrobia bacterium]|nr:type II toxin-antitoxin system VapC family toxin [Verrucomicrobiota bacterium]
MATAYIETTIPSYYVARPSNSLIQAARQASTREWWDRGCSGFHLFTSLETLDEVAKGDGEMAAARQCLLAAVRLLPVTDEAIALASTLVTTGVVPAKAASDAMHIAVASVHGINYLVTWNFKHIANPFTRDRLRLAVADVGFELPVMCSPDELLQNNEDD